jgi:hypothetical protein
VSKTETRPSSAPRLSGLRGLLTLGKLLVVGQFRFKRRGQGLGGVHVVFGETVLSPRDEPAAPATLAAPTTDPARPQATLTPAEQSVLDDLGAALRAQGERRVVFRHLLYLEQQIGRAGLRGLPSLPLDVLRKTFDQLSLLAHDDAARGLIDLKTRLSRLLVQRGHRDHLLVDDHATPSDFLHHAQPLVAEGRISEFLNATDDTQAGPR